MTLTTFTASTTIVSADVNANFLNAYPRVVASTPYTGNGFDVSQSTNGSSTNTTTLTVASGTIKDYIRIVCTFLSWSAHSGTNATDATTALKIETSVASAASWTIRFNQTVEGSQVSNIQNNAKCLRTIEFYYAPTAGEKSSGLDIKFTSTATCGVSGGTAQTGISNVQTMVFAN